MPDVGTGSSGGSGMDSEESLAQIVGCCSELFDLLVVGVPAFQTMGYVQLMRCHADGVCACLQPHAFAVKITSEKAS